MKTRINLLYEFNTPIGYLSMGYKRQDIPHIFEYILNIDSSLNVDMSRQTSVRFFSNGTYKKLINDTDFYFRLTDDNIRFSSNEYIIKQLHYSNVTLFKNTYNFFNILMPKEETCTDFLNTDLSLFFLKDTLQFIQNNSNVKIIFNDIWEGANNYNNNFFDVFYKFINEYNLDSKQVCFVTNSFNIEKKYIGYIHKKNIKSFMIVKTIPYYVYPAPCINFQDAEREGSTDPTTGSALKGNSNYFIDNSTGIEYSYPTFDEIDLKRNKYYLNLNRNTGRLHRAELVLHLINKNIKDKGLISFHKSKEFDRFCDIPSNIEYKNKIQKEYPFILDQEDADTVAQMNNIFGNKKMWLDTYFSIVSETSVSKHHAFITEKTVKPLFYFHPFIIWGNPFSLKFLKEIGFETFPEFFDESYDTIIDEDKRLSLIVENIERLCSKDIKEIHGLYQSVKPKLLHNYNLLKKMYYDDKFINEFLKIWK